MDGMGINFWLNCFLTSDQIGTTLHDGKGHQVQAQHPVHRGNHEDPLVKNLLGDFLGDSIINCIPISTFSYKKKLFGKTPMDTYIIDT